jgi:hypothetical protein
VHPKSVSAYPYALHPHCNQQHFRFFIVLHVGFDQQTQQHFGIGNLYPISDPMTPIATMPSSKQSHFFFLGFLA